MATVPGVLYLCEYHGQGGNPGLNANCDGLLGTNLRDLLDREILRVVPDDPTTGVPNAATLGCYPWYDGHGGDTLYVVASSSTTTITVSPSPGWTTNQWAGRKAVLLNTAPIPGVGFARKIPIFSNTADTITFGATTAPTVGQFFWLGKGVFNDYHPAAGWLHLSEVGNPSRRTGSSYATDGQGVGPDATMLRRILERVYASSPYFNFWKWASPVAITSGWAESPNDTARAEFLAEKTRVDAAATARGNTIAWKYVIIDLSMNDLQAAVSNPLVLLFYKSRLLELITWLRSSAFANDPDLKIVLVNHREDLWSVTAPSATLFLRSTHNEVVAEQDNVNVADLNGLRIGIQSGATDTPATEAKYYAQTEYFTGYGDRVVETMVRMAQGTPIEASGGFPIYIVIGDSIMSGPIPLTWTQNLANPQLAGPTVGSLLRPSNQLVWNRGPAVLEVYLPHTNSNTSGTVNANAGPEMSITAYLGLLHPDGFGLIKRGSAGSGLASAIAYSSGNNGRWTKSANEHYQELQADFAGAVAYINTTLGKQADMRGMFVSLGHNDHVQTNGAATFASALPQFCRDVWQDFKTRTSGPNFPIQWRRPQLDAAGVVTDQLTIVRDALQTQSEAEPQFGWTDVDDLQRDKTDNLHESADSSIEDGYRLAADLQTRALA